MIIYRIINLPTNIHGFVMEDENGDSNVYINARDASCQQTMTAEHETAHVIKNHIHDPRPVAELEAEAPF